MATEPGHIQITEFNKEVIPQVNWMMEDLFCRYGVSIPWFLLDFDFPDYSQRPNWCTGYNFNLDWGKWGYYLSWFNEWLGFLFDEANLPRLTLPDLSLDSVSWFNDYVNMLYDEIYNQSIYGQSGTFVVCEDVVGETSEVTCHIKVVENGTLRLINCTGNMTDEKIVGQTSGAYAWTYEDYEQEFTCIVPDPHQVIGYAIVDSVWNEWILAWEEWFSNPSYETGTGTTARIGWRGTLISGDRYKISLYKHYFSFDTSSASGFMTAKLKVNLLQHITYGRDVILRVYKQDWGDDIDIDDWTGGTLVGTLSLPDGTETGWKEVTLDSSAVTLGGNTKLRIASDQVETIESTPDHSLFVNFEKTTMKLILS